MSTKPDQPVKAAARSLTLGYDCREDADMSSNPCIRVLATLSNHYGELGSSAEFLRKAAQIRDVLERPDDPFAIRIFARQDADDVLDASDPSEWLEVEVQELEAEPGRDEMLRHFQQVLCLSQALFKEEAKKDSPPSPSPAR